MSGELCYVSVQPALKNQADVPKHRGMNRNFERHILTGVEKRTFDKWIFELKSF